MGEPGKAPAELTGRYPVQSPFSLTPYLTRPPPRSREAANLRLNTEHDLANVFPNLVPGTLSPACPSRSLRVLLPPRLRSRLHPKATWRHHLPPGGGDPLSIPPQVLHCPPHRGLPDPLPPPHPQLAWTLQKPPRPRPPPPTPRHPTAPSLHPTAPHPPALGELRAAPTSDAFSPSRALAAASLTAAGTGRRVGPGSERLPSGSALRPLRGPESRVLPRRQPRKLSVRRPCPPPAGPACAGARLAPPLPTRAARAPGT